MPGVSVYIDGDTPANRRPAEYLGDLTVCVHACHGSALPTCIGGRDPWPSGSGYKRHLACQTRIKAEPMCQTARFPHLWIHVIIHSLKCP